MHFVVGGIYLCELGLISVQLILMYLLNDTFDLRLPESHKFNLRVTQKSLRKVVIIYVLVVGLS